MLANRLFYFAIATFVIGALCHPYAVRAGGDAEPRAAAVHVGGPLNVRSISDAPHVETASGAVRAGADRREVAEARARHIYEQLDSSSDVKASSSRLSLADRTFFQDFYSVAGSEIVVAIEPLDHMSRESVRRDPALTATAYDSIRRYSTFSSLNNFNNSLKSGWRVVVSIERPPHGLESL